MNISFPAVHWITLPEEESAEKAGTSIAWTCIATCRLRRSGRNLVWETAARPAEALGRTITARVSAATPFSSE